MFSNNGSRLTDIINEIDCDYDQKIIDLVNEILLSRHVLIFGNGGSMSDADHFATELSGRFCKKRKPIFALCPSSAGFLTCIANDWDFNHIFVRFVEAYGHQNSVIIGMTTSGESENVLSALKSAKSSYRCCLTSKSAEQDIRNFCNMVVGVPSNSTARIQEVHKLFLHTVAAQLDERLKAYDH
jgi:D-sedoheptulose 7-phosphate isomerase